MATTNYITVNGMIIAEETNGVYRAYGLDALGSVVATYTGSAIENTYQYKPYGGILAKTGTAVDPSFLWNGGSGYRATGLTYSEFYVRNRIYSETSAQWTTRDPNWPSEPPFVYCAGSPVLIVDESGTGCTNSPDYSR
jgi:RHS repeat-associated protein